MNNKFIVTISLLFVILFNFRPVFARETSKLEEEFKYLESEIIIITATRLAQKISDAPGTVIVITKKQIKERGYSNLLDLLEDLPSVDVNRYIEEFYNMITFRGNVEQEKIIIMRDSQRISSPTGERLPISENFPLFNAKQVEIVFGPVSALYGADAFTGVINIITEEAKEVDGAVVSSSIGSFDYYNNYLKFGKQLTKNINFTVSGHYHSSDNADLSKYYSEYDNTDLIVSGSTYLSAENREAFILPTKSYSTFVKLDLFDHFTIGFNQSYYNHPSGIGAARSMAFLGKEQKWETLIRNYYSEYNYDEGKKVSGKSTISYITYEVLPDTKYRNQFTNFEDIGYKYARSNKFSLEQQINYQLSEQHNFTGGVSWENYYSLPKTGDLSKPFDPNLPADSQSLFYGGTDNTLPMKIFELYYHNIASYLQAQSEWTDIISSTIGIRFDYNSRYGNSVNPRGGLIIQPSKKTTLEFFYGEAYLAPSPYLAYSHFGTFSGTKNSDGEYISTFMHLPNPDLLPQKTRSPEINLTHKFTPDFIVTLTGYYSWVDNIITDTFHSTTSDFVSGGEILTWKRYENKGEAEIYGGDIRADYHTRAGRFDLKFWGNYSFVDGWEDDGSGIKLDLRFIANHKIKAGLTATFDKKYFISPNIRWIDETTHVRVEPSDPTKRQHADAYTLVNLHSGINNLFEGLSVYLTVRNLLDNRYFNAGASSLARSPQEPRKIIGTVEYKF